MVHRIDVNEITSTAAVTANLTQLGQTRHGFPEQPSASLLETFENRSPGREYWIRFTSREFTSLCPVTGQPDFAKIAIDYVPGDRCVETKSFKMYLAAYRNCQSFNEEVVNRILDDLVEACRPRRMRVQGEFSSRGGIGVTVNAYYPEPFDLPAGTGAGV
jgi:7-cyano-7-deazaguanine reductase